MVRGAFQTKLILEPPVALDKLAQVLFETAEEQDLTLLYPFSYVRSSVDFSSEPLIIMSPVGSREVELNIGQFSCYMLKQNSGKDLAEIHIPSFQDPVSYLRIHHDKGDEELSSYLLAVSKEIEIQDKA